MRSSLHHHLRNFLGLVSTKILSGLNMCKTTKIIFWNLFQQEFLTIKRLGGEASFKTRLMIANGAFISKLSYLISVWGASENYLLRSLQIVQNKVARTVTKMPWSTTTSALLAACDWLTVQQLAMYQTILLVYKVMKTGSPAYIHSMFSTEYECPTRQGLLKPSTTSKIPSTELASSSFRHRALLQYNLLPVHVRDASNENLFKSLAKIWIVENIPVDWGFNISMVMFTTPFISDGWKFTQK